MDGGEHPRAEEQERRGDRQEQAGAGAGAVRAGEEPEDAEVEKELRERERVPEVERARDRRERDARPPRGGREPAHAEREPEHEQRRRGGEDEEPADDPVRDHQREHEEHRPAVAPEHAQQVERRGRQPRGVEREGEPARRLEGGERAHGAQEHDRQHDRREREADRVRAGERRAGVAAVAVRPREDEEVRIVLHRQEVRAPERRDREDREDAEDEIEDAIARPSGGPRRRAHRTPPLLAIEAARASRGNERGASMRGTLGSIGRGVHEVGSPDRAAAGGPAHPRRTCCGRVTSHTTPWYASIPRSSVTAVASALQAAQR